MIFKGFELTLVGMTVVFSMLTLMVVIMKATYRGLLIFNRFFPEKDTAAPVGKGRTGLEDEIAVAIAAVKAYKMEKGER